MSTGEYEVFHEIWKDAHFFYQPDMAKCRTFLELIECMKFRRLEQLLPTGPLTSLEFGCGSAGVSLYFHDHHRYEVFLLDRSLRGIEFARENFRRFSIRDNPKYRTVLADCLDMPFPDGSFDVVMSFGLLEHFKDIGLPIREALRVLKPGGVIFSDIVTRRLSVDSPFKIPRMGIRALTALMRGDLKDIPAAFRNPFYENSYRIDAYIKKLHECGARVTFASGNRPFPILPRLDYVSLAYTRLRLFQTLWKRFDFSESRIAKLLGPGWWIRAEKT